MPKLFLVFGGVGAFLAVACGAFGAHALKARLDPYFLSVFQTAVYYQMAHSLALVLVGLLIRVTSVASFRWSGIAFIIGIFIFSGSLYALSLTQARWWGAVTPLGGLCFLVGWIFFVRSAARI